MIPHTDPSPLSVSLSLSLSRNEAWRYAGGFARPVTLSEVLFKGFKWGFAAFTVALAIEYTFFPPKKGGH
uniref:NADH dehydrogenase [ubiquinone] 1 beta subcomplex subunit 3 n=1 Tax=Mastacembelus armatus TaxID=205130 RepID=A0A3Q3SRW7_9TELE